jgi:hypothetical protein
MSGLPRLAPSDSSRIFRVQIAGPDCCARLQDIPPLIENVSFIISLEAPPRLRFRPG